VDVALLPRSRKESAKDEYLLYRNALKNNITSREELNGVDLKHILQAREEGLKLLRSLTSRTIVPLFQSHDLEALARL
jgi:hypothetical protein